MKGRRPKGMSDQAMFMIMRRRIIMIIILIMRRMRMMRMRMTMERHSSGSSYWLRNSSNAAMVFFLIMGLRDLMWLKGMDANRAHAKFTVLFIYIS